MQFFMTELNISKLIYFLSCILLTDRVKKFLHIFENYESPFVVWVSFMPVVILTKPEDIQVRIQDRTSII